MMLTPKPKEQTGINQKWESWRSKTLLGRRKSLAKGQQRKRHATLRDRGQVQKGLCEK